MAPARRMTQADKMLLHADDIDPWHGSFCMDSPPFNDKEPGPQITSSPESMADVIKALEDRHIKSHKP